MSNRSVLLREIETLPAACLNEVVNFLAWVKHRELSKVPDPMLLSESVLSKDWNTPEEEEAWAHL